VKLTELYLKQISKTDSKDDKESNFNGQIFAKKELLEQVDLVSGEVLC